MRSASSRTGSGIHRKVAKNAKAHAPQDSEGARDAVAQRVANPDWSFQLSALRPPAAPRLSK